MRPFVVVECSLRSLCSRREKTACREAGIRPRLVARAVHHDETLTVLLCVGFNLECNLLCFMLDWTVLLTGIGSSVLAQKW
jgi:hypothetical protein